MSIISCSDSICCQNLLSFHGNILKEVLVNNYMYKVNLYNTIGVSLNNIMKLYVSFYTEEVLQQYIVT